MKSPEVLENCSIGFHFPSLSEEAVQLQAKLLPLKLLHFYKADEYYWTLVNAKKMGDSSRCKSFMYFLIALAVAFTLIEGSHQARPLHQGKFSPFRTGGPFDSSDGVKALFSMLPKGPLPPSGPSPDIN
ncbi:conserved hypothetical protein [Ricinus communis]|uniref:Uncharacterized protein n=1 Tax=Ricinus communis TaxID=3988 RepID=B9RW11_RICCO|nr:conserved hypothetical protein [Ricinus communis]